MTAQGPVRDHRPALVGAFLVLGALLVLLVAADDAAATHYRYGTLSWEPTGEPNEVRFTGAQAWRASAFGDPSVGSIIPGEAQIATGDGAHLPIHLLVTSRNPVNDWFFATLVDAAGNEGVTHTYATPDNNGSPWAASWGSCCRISPHSSGNFHVNNPDQSERLETRVDLTTGNSGPQTNLPPINPCPLEAVCTLPIPFLDPDADALSFRLATATEAGDTRYVPPGPPHAPHAATIDATTGTITWNTTDATYSPTEHTLYSIQVILEDGETKTPLDFFIELIPDSVSPPQWAAGSACGRTVTAYAGATASFTVTARSDDPARRITLDHLGIPSGASFQHASPDNPVTGTFTWTPTMDDEGTHLMIFTAHDDRGYAAPSCPVKVEVHVEDPPYFIDPSPCGFAARIEGTTGIPIAFAVAAASDNLSQVLTMDLVAGPTGLVFAPDPPANPVHGTAHWSHPTAGQHSVTLRVTDLFGISALCTVHIDIVPPSGQTLALALWGGSAVPFSIEHSTHGVDHRTTQDSTEEESRTAVVVTAPSLGARAEGIEESGAVTITPGRVEATGRTEITHLDLAGGLVQAEGLVLDATLSWDWTNNTTTVIQTASIAHLTVAGNPIPVDPVPQEIPLPGGGRLVLFERIETDGTTHSSYAANLVHAYLPASYGRAEVIVGSVLLQGGVDVPFTSQLRDILEEDDGDSGGDATEDAPVPLTPGIVEGALDGRGDVDHYTLALHHGEKVQFLLQPAPRVTATGGGLFADDTPDAIWAPPTIALHPFDRFTIDLYDPTGTLRDSSELGVAGGPERIELNADLDGDWTLQVGRTGLTDARINYTLATGVTPVPLREQDDASSGADAPALCDPYDTAIPTITDGTWPGVLRDDDHVDVYRFDAAIGDLVTVVLKPGETLDGVDMALALYDRTCGLVAYSDVDLAALKGQPELTLRVPSEYTGTYFVGIERQNGVGNHYLTLRVQDPLPGLPDNDAGSGSDAPSSRHDATDAPPVAFTGAFHDGDPGDAYLLRFDATQGEAHVLIDIGAGSAFTPRLYTPEGQLVPHTQHLPSLAVYRFDPTSTGAYGLELTPLSGGGDYVVAYGQGPATP